MWSTLWQKIKEVIRKMLPSKSIEQTLHVAPIMSNRMSEALKLWDDMYKDQAPWIKSGNSVDPVKVVSLGLPAMIASEKARMAIIELQSEISVPTKDVEKENPEFKDPKEGDITLPRGERTIVESQPVSSDERAKWLNEVYQKKVIDKLRPQLEYGIAKGGLVMKPYIVPKEVTDNKTGTPKKTQRLEVDFIQADAFFPLAFNAGGEITEAAFVQTKIDKNSTYRRLEHHILTGTTVTVRNRAFKSENTQTQSKDTNETDLGKEIPLTDVPEWASLKPEQKIANVDRLLFAYFKMPEANTIDTLSPLGVSGYSRAVSQIREADLQFSRMLWEFEAGEMAVNVDRDAFAYMADPSHRNDGRSYLPKMQQRLYRQVDVDPNQELFEPYAPALRDASIINGLNNILMRIEDICALSRGTLSDVSSEARTATELKILKQRTYQANCDIQEALQKALEDVVYVMNVYATLYDLVPDGEYEASFEWDDSILVDVDTELNKRITLMQNGLASKLEVRMWYFGETESQAKEALRKINDESREAAEENMMVRKAMGTQEKPQNDEME